MLLKSIAASKVGHVRDHNEDAVFADDELGLWLVADGMGGHAAGEVASQLAVDTIAGDVAEGGDLLQAVQRAHLAIKSASKANHEQAGMGTTLVAAQKVKHGFRLVWSGDSRVYAWSARGLLRQLSRDHSFVEDLVLRGVLSEEEAQNHPKKNLICQALGMTGIPHFSPSEIYYRPPAGGGLLLCSDGVSDMLTFDELSTILLAGHNLADAGLALTHAIENTSATDNFSFVLLQHQDTGFKGLLQRWRKEWIKP